MKEEKQIRTRKKSFKGSVLFTVVAVMMVLIVFVMATLTIAGAANKRAYASYSKNQTTYTARSAIESVYTAMSDTSNTALSNAVKGLANGSSMEISVTLPDASMGTIKDNKITVQCLPVADRYSQVTIDSATNSLKSVDRDVVKITATAVLGTEESTVSAYYLKDPSSPPPSMFKNALTTMGSALTGTSGKAYGGANVGITSSKWTDKATGTYDSMNLQNNGVMTADFLSNKSITCGGGGKFQFTKPGQGMVILGDFNQQKDNGKFESIVDVSATSMNYNELPYVYVEGDFNLYQDNYFGSYNNPINIYTGGSLNVNGNLRFYSDIYIYDHDFSKDASDSIIDASEITSNQLNATSNFWTYSDPGGLLGWYDNLISKNPDNPSVGSNIFSKGSVAMGQDSRSTYQVQGDLIVEKDLTLNGGLQIDGSIVCEGNLTIHHGNRDKYVSGGIFCDPDKTTIDNNTKINGQVYNGGDVAEYIKNVNANATSNNGDVIVVASSGFKYTLDTTDASTYKTSLKNMISADKNGTGTNGTDTVHLFPASKELIEILGYGDPANKIINTVAETQNEYTTSINGNTYFKIGKLDKDELSPSEISDLNSSSDTKNTILDEPTCDRTIINFGNGKIQFIQEIKQELAPDGITLVDNTYTYYDGSPEVNAYYKTVNLNGVNTNVVNIDKNCTIQGTIQFGQIVYVDPSATSGLWIKVGNLTFTNPNGFNGIIVNDSNPNSLANFYIKQDCSVNLDGSYVFTQSYYEKFCNSSALDVKENPSVDYIPNIYIYSGRGTTHKEIVSWWPRVEADVPNTELFIHNNGMVTAYVVAPYLYLHEDNAVSTGKFAGVSYEDETGITGELTVLGSAIVGEAKINNDAIVMFIDPTGGGGGTPPGASGDWALLYYQNS